MFDQLTRPKTKLPMILAGSIVLHSAAVGLMFVSWVWGIALEFGELRFEEGGDSTVKVAMLDRTKPLYMPAGFYAITKPPEEIVAPAPPVKEEPKSDEKKEESKSDEDGKKDGAEDGVKDEKAPGKTGNFGTLGGKALKPHLTQVYNAYERGQLSVSSFSVTVSCRAMPDGSLADIRITKSSGDRLIDETGVNLVTEISNQKALAPLSTLSSLSLTLEKSDSQCTLAAVGFSDDPDASAEMARKLGLAKWAASFKMENDDQKRLLNSVQISQSGNRLTVSATLPNAMAGDMMQRSFGSTAKAGT